VRHPSPHVQLRDLLRLDLDRVEVDPTETYEMVGVYSFGRGLFDREPVHGGSTSYKHYYRLNTEHIVMSQLFGWEGALGLSSEEFAGKFVSPQFPTFAADEERVDRNFLGWFMRRKPFWEELGTRTRGMGDRRRTLNPDALFACEIPLPPLPEQRRVVAKIDRLAARIDEARGLRGKSLEEPYALLQSALSRALPRNAPAPPLTQVIAAGSRVSYGVLVPGPDVEDGIPFVRVQDLAINNPQPSPAKHIAPEVDAQYTRTRLRGGEVLVGVVGSIGKVGIAPTSWAGANIARAVCKIVPGPKVSTRYLATVLSSSRCQEFFRDATRTLAQPTLNVALLSRVPIPLPSLDEQNRIVAYLDGLQAKVDRLKALQAQTRTELDALLPSILDRAFKSEL
jgi:hypothetical protein